MSKQFLGVIAAILLVFIGIFAFGGNKKTDSTKTDSKTLTNHTKGAEGTSVNLTEYGDFQCSSCFAYFPTVEQVLAEYKDRVTFQFRHFPLTNIHPNAFAASRAAEAAGLQNKFFEMYSMLYMPANFQTWTVTQDPNPEFQAYAQQIGLDLAKFKTDFASSKVNASINADMAEGTRLEVSGTPSFFINGKATKINNTPDAFRKAIDEALAKSGKKKPAASTTETSTPVTDPTATTPSDTPGSTN